MTEHGDHCHYEVDDESNLVMHHADDQVQVIANIDGLLNMADIYEDTCDYLTEMHERAILMLLDDVGEGNYDDLLDDRAWMHPATGLANFCTELLHRMAIITPHQRCPLHTRTWHPLAMVGNGTITVLGCDLVEGDKVHLTADALMRNHGQSVN